MAWAESLFMYIFSTVAAATTISNCLIKHAFTPSYFFLKSQLEFALLLVRSFVFFSLIEKSIVTNKLIDFQWHEAQEDEETEKRPFAAVPVLSEH